MHSGNSSSSTLAQSHYPHSSTTGDSHRRKSGHGQRHHHLNDLQPGIFFLASRAVTVCFGPYTVLGVMDYRTERLEGLKKSLQNAGGEVKLIPSYHVNEVRVWHLERQIFACQITDLFFDRDREFDTLCKAAEKALEKSIRRAYFNLKFRYQLDACLLEVCPCHTIRHSNDSLVRVPCRKNKPKSHMEETTKEDQLEGGTHAEEQTISPIHTYETGRIQNIPTETAEM